MHKLFTSCIQWGLVSRDSVVNGDWLHATQRWRQLADVVNPRRTSQKICGGFLYAVYRPGERLWIDSTRNPVKGYSGSESLAICNHCRVMAAWSSNTLKFFTNFCIILEKRPLAVKFFNFCSESWKFSSRHWSTLLCVLISWKLANKKSVKSCVAYLKNKFCAALQLSLLRRLCPKSARDSHWAQYTQECSGFHPNRFTIGRVIAERVNTTKTRHKVNPIFGWSLALSRIITTWSVCLWMRWSWVPCCRKDKQNTPRTLTEVCDLIQAFRCLKKSRHAGKQPERCCISMQDKTLHKYGLATSVCNNARNAFSEFIRRDDINLHQWTTNNITAKNSQRYQ